MIARLCLLAVVLVCVPARAFVQQTLDPTQLLGAYRVSRSAETIGQLREPRDLAGFLKTLSPALKQTDAEVASGFLLEVAIMGFRTGQATAAIEILERGCEIARSLPRPSGFATVWQSAALALVEGASAGVDFKSAEAPNLATEYQTSALPIGGVAKELLGHFGHIKDVLGDGTVALAYAVSQEQRAWNGEYLVARAMRPDFSDSSGYRNRNLSLASDQIQEAIKRFEKAELFPDVREEALLRKGALLGLMGKHKEALLVLSSMSSDDPWRRYLASLFSARSLGSLNRPDEAERALAEALSAWPTGSSASVLLVALLKLEGRDADAMQHVSALRAVPTGARDPWLEYRYGDYRFLDMRVGMMRELLK